jgi:MoxR-like ATPase
MTEQTLEERTARVREESAFVLPLLREIEGTIVGQGEMVRRILIGLLADGHLLLEGVPGLAKTLAVKTVAQTIEARFHRIQFTPDLLPADLTGTLVYDQKSGAFTPKFGPVFTQILLADEVNRAPAKVQSALLEAMQERQVTIGETTYPLPDPFLVLATQNPIEQEGTYPLPEAQVDRFMLKVVVGYPSKTEERQILDLMATSAPLPSVNPVLEPRHVIEARRVVDQIYVDDKVKDYIVDLVWATREPANYKLDLAAFIQYGASPRATINLTLAAKAEAFLAGRGYVTPQDVKTIGMDVLRHRVIVSYEAEAEGMRSEDVVARIFDSIPVP